MQATGENTMQMSQEEFVQIRDFIHERSGIFFAENKMYLVKNRLARRMAELQIKTVRDYFYRVKYDVSQREFKKLMDLVTTNETSFFRNEPQLRSFQEEVLPLLLKEKQASGGKKSIRIWSAGCSTGEEPYTLAIILLEALKASPGWTVEIIANDISEEVLQKARQGRYSGLTLRNMKPDVLARHFVQDGEHYQVTPAVKALVKFSHVNLNEPRSMSLVGDVDVVFCRNVMIYFSDEVKKDLVRRFFDSLQPGGFFFIGHSETLHGISKAFKLMYFKHALVYRKEPVADARPARPTIGGNGARANQTSTASSGANRAIELLKQIKPLTAQR